MARPLPKGTRERLAACGAVGLHYWSDHPQKGCVWAVDNDQRAHVVRIDRDAGTAKHICASAVPVAVDRCAGDDEALPFNIDNINNLFEGEPQMTTQKSDRPTQGEAVEDSPTSPYQEGAHPVTNISQSEFSVDEPSVNGSGPEEVKYDPLKLSNLRSRSDVLKGVWTDPSRVPIWSAPEQNVWVRVRPGEDYTAILDFLVATNASHSGDRNPLYVATDDVRPELERFVKPHRVVVGVTHHDKVIFLWARAVGQGSNTWTDSIMRAMDEAETNWISLESDRPHGEYKVHQAPKSKVWGPPDWRDQSLEDVVGLAFRDRIIDSLEHVVAKRLLGLDD